MANWVEKYGGRRVDLLDLQEGDIQIRIIAHCLAMKCRYSGDVRAFYSVAQHCCLVAGWVSAQPGATYVDAFQALLHDAAEAYLVDIPAPVKGEREFRGMVRLESRIQRQIYEHYGVPAEKSQWLRYADPAICIDEAEALMASGGAGWGVRAHFNPLGLEVVPWSWEIAERRYLRMFRCYSNAAWEYTRKQGGERREEICDSPQ